MNLSLSEKNALVCGSTQGIGLAIAEELALLGANCILLARNKQVLKDVIKKLNTDQGQLHHYLVADFSRPAEVKSVIDQFTKHQVIHVLINNTGGPKPGLIAAEEEQHFLDAFSQHIICNHVLTKAVLPGMKAAGYGRIINIISTSVKIPIQNLGVSNTVRAAVAAWGKTLANELGDFGITVNNLLPGYTNTKRLQSLIETNAAGRGVGAAVVAAEMKERIPLKRFGEASEIAAVAAFLASPAASFVNGISIPVDGGSTGSI